MSRRWLAARYRLRLRALLPGAAALAAALAVGGLLFAWSGLLNVGASDRHWSITEHALAFVLRNAVATHSLTVDVPPLADADLERLGAGHFAGGCAPCHGAPGEPAAPTFAQMLPAPPPLSQAARRWRPAELFWIVENGLKFTGMPAWAARGRSDEVWAVVAFLHRLPALSPEDYRTLAGIRQAVPSAEAIAHFGTGALAVTSCASCHGDAASPPRSRLVPALAGQSRSYLAHALRDYAAGTRASGIMQPIAAQLDDAEIALLSRYYGDLPRHPASAAVPPAPPERIAHGRRLAVAGAPEQGLPPCLACHGRAARATFPRLAGQPAPYLAGQLLLWQAGQRDRTVLGAIMAPIARRLTAGQIDAVAAYLESAPESDDGAAGSGAAGSGAGGDAARASP